ncbi:MAG: hypothetical protein AAF798_02185 [Bacteroidota bacterium]
MNQSSLLLLTLCLFACSPCKTLVVKKDLDVAYQASIRDAAQPETSKISDDLWSLSAENPDLIQDDQGRVLVMTWTSWDGYKQSTGQPMTLSRDIWVTPAPQLQDFCTKLRLDSADMQLRLKQLLGLPPTGNKSYFAEMWVAPSDCFRPCPDPEVTDQMCSLAYPTSSRGNVNPAHQQWIENLRAESYGPEGYPWTQLGYTYDWGNPKYHVGLSECVVPEGATVLVNEAFNIYDYCSTKR